MEKTRGGGMKMLSDSGRRFSWGLAGLLVLITVLVFIRVGGFGFVMWDDDSMLYANPHVQALGAEQLRWMFTDTTYNRVYMPLGWLDYAVTFWMFGLRPGAHHLVNLGLHLVDALLVYAVLLELMKCVIRGGGIGAENGAAGNPRARALAAFAGAVFWAIHPLRVEVVAWVGARVHCFAGVFLLGAAWCYLRAAIGAERAVWKRPLYWAAVVLYGLSLLAFPAGIMLPAVLLVLDWYVLGRRGMASWRRAGMFLLEKVPFGVVAAVPLGLSIWGRATTTVKVAAPTLAQFGIVSRVMQACYVWIHYMVVLVRPVDLSPVYTQLVEFFPFDPVFLACFGLVLGITAATFYLRRRYPKIWATWLCHLLILLPFLGLSEHPHYASDRYTYFAGIVWSAVLAAGVWRLLMLKEARRSAKLVGLTAIAVVIGSFGFLAFEQTSIWVNSEVLFRYAIAELGDDVYRADIYRRLANYYVLERQPTKAATAIDELLRMSISARGRRGVPREVLMPLDELEHFIAAGPQPAASNLAMESLARAEKEAPRDTDLYLLLGKLLAETGKRAEATGQLDAAIRLDPSIGPNRAMILGDWFATTQPGE